MTTYYFNMKTKDYSTYFGVYKNYVKKEKYTVSFMETIIILN